MRCSVLLLWLLLRLRSSRTYCGPSWTNLFSGPWSGPREIMEDILQTRRSGRRRDSSHTGNLGTNIISKQNWGPRYKASFLKHDQPSLSWLDSHLLIFPTAIFRHHYSRCHRPRLNPIHRMSTTAQPGAPPPLGWPISPDLPSKSGNGDCRSSKPNTTLA